MKINCIIHCCCIALLLIPEQFPLYSLFLLMFHSLLPEIQVLFLQEILNS